MKKTHFTILLCAAVVLLGAIVYGMTMRGEIGNFNTQADFTHAPTAPMDPFESSHERAPYAQMVAISSGQGFNLSKPEADFGAPDVGYANGRFYSFFPPGVSLVSTPLYEIGTQYNLGQVFAYGTMLLISLFSFVILFLIARQTFKLSKTASLLVVLIFGFGTIYWSYSSTMYQHALTTFIMLLSFYSVWMYSRKGTLSWIWAALVWFLFAFSFFVDYPDVVLMAPIMGYLVISAFSFSYSEHDKKYRATLRVSLILTSIFFIVCMGAQLAYNKSQFGNYLQFSNRLPRYQITNLSDLQLQDQSVATSKNADTASIFQEMSLPNGIYELTVAPDKGLFFFSPILLLAFLGIYEYRKKLNIAHWIALFTIAMNFFLYASTTDPYGGWAFGPRYVIPAIPFLAIFVGMWIQSGKKKIWKNLAALVLFAFSSAVALIGAMTTDVVPPRVEAVYFNIKYGVSYAFSFFQKGQTGSFIYKSYFQNILSVSFYAWLIYALIFVIFLLAVFILPYHDHEF